MQLRSIDRYLLKSLISASIFGSLIALVVLISLQVMRLSQVFVRFDLELIFILKMIYGLGVSFLPLLFPITLLFALLIVLGKMSTDREFIAMQAMGYSPLRLLYPCLGAAAFFAALTFIFSFTLGPAGNRKFDALVDEAFKRRVASALRSGTFSEGFLNMVLFVDEVDPATQKLSRVFVYDENSFARSVAISSKSGYWNQNPNEGVGILKLEDGAIVSLAPENNTLWRIEFDEYVLKETFDRPVGWSKQSPPSQGWTGILQKLNQARKDKEFNGRPFQIEFSRRFALAIFCLLLVPLCFAISVDNKRTAKSRSVFAGITILLSYWTMYFAVVSWASKSSLSIFNYELGTMSVIWLPNLLVVLVTLFFWRYRFIRS